MKPENIALLHRLTQTDVSEYRTDKTVGLSTKNLCGTLEDMKQVWFSPTGFGSKDDAQAVGYVELPHGVRLDERKCRNYKLSVTPTAMYELFSKSFNHIEQVEQVSLEHQKGFFPFLFVE